MGTDELLARLAGRPFLIIGEAESEELASECESVRETRPPLAAPLLTLVCARAVFVIETSDKNELLLRSFDSEEAAAAFVKARLDSYDRMWDGCGCKVNYYE